MEIHHKTAFEAKSLDFLAFCSISLISTEIFLDILLNLLLYTCTCINLKREKEGKILNQLLNQLCMFIYPRYFFLYDFVVLDA